MEILERIWSEPITDNEIEIVERVIVTGSETQLRQWLTHCLKMLKVQRGIDNGE